MSQPQMPNAGGHPSHMGYENGAQSHMPPPLDIPQSFGGAPTSLSSFASPLSAGASRAAPEPNKRALYVGGLDPRVSEDVLKQIFETTGHVQSVKIIPDKNVSLYITTGSNWICGAADAAWHVATEAWTQ